MTGVPRKPLPDLALSRTGLDRATAWRRRPGVLDDPDARVLELRAGLLPVDEAGLVLRDPRPGDAEVLRVHLGGPRDDAGDAGETGDTDDAPHVVAVLREDAPDGEAGGAGTASDDGTVRWASLREVGWRLGARDIGLATTAVAMERWHAVTRWCARCGGPLAVADAGWVRRCAQGHDSYPATSPAVIMAVTDDDDRLLLARGATWPAPSRSVLAGFVEPGESLEAAVAREVHEEVGVPVTDVRYEGNQPWPFPASLMVGFTARATSTALRPDPAEIAEAGWFTREQLADAAVRGELSLPPSLSIAHHLVAQWYGGPPPGSRAG